MVSKKSKIVYSVKVSTLKFVSLPIADQFQPKFCKLPCVEQRIAKLDWKITMYRVVNCPWIFIFILLCLILSRFLILFIYIINIGYRQVLFITWEKRGKSYSTTSTFKCQGSTCTCFLSSVSLPNWPCSFILLNWSIVSCSILL